MYEQLDFEDYTPNFTGINENVHEASNIIEQANLGVAKQVATSDFITLLHKLNDIHAKYVSESTDIMARQQLEISQLKDVIDSQKSKLAHIDDEFNNFCVANGVIGAWVQHNKG